jgi:hypothetical protein
MSLTNIDGILANIDLTPDSLQGAEGAKEPESTNNESISESSYSEETPVSENAENGTDKTDKSASTETAIDDYGQPVAKKERVYTQSEVEQMMRDRNTRGEFAKQQLEQPVQPVAQEASEDWQQEFESLVEQTISKREQKIQQQHWQQQAEQKQAEFEIKFNAGATKYADFEQVVMGKPLTIDMVKATMGMNDPAAFIYAAAKTQATELERISKIPDALSQAVELGKLEERMRKSKSASSGAPRPIDTIKGDAQEKSVRHHNVDDILRKEQQERMRSRK